MTKLFAIIAIGVTLVSGCSLHPRSVEFKTKYINVNIELEQTK